MAVIDYVKLQNDAETAIDDNGRDIILLKRNRTPAVTAQPWRGAADLPLEVEGTTIKAIFAPVSGNRFTKINEAEDEQIHRSDRDQFLLSGKVVVAAGIDLTEYDAVQDDTVIWRITSVQEEKPGPLSLLFHLNVVR